MTTATFQKGDRVEFKEFPEVTEGIVELWKRRFFVRLFEELAKPGMPIEMLRQEVDGDTAYIVWKAETADNRFELGTDTFIVQNGKIVTQTFAGKISPKQ